MAMKLYKGTYYTEEDLAREKKREAAEARRARAAAGVTDLTPASHVGDEPIAVFVARVVSEAVGPLAERVRELEEQVKELSEAITSSVKGSTDPELVAPEAESTGDPADAPAAVPADDPEEPAAEVVPEAPKRPSSRGGRTGKALSTKKDGE